MDYFILNFYMNNNPDIYNLLQNGYTDIMLLTDMESNMTNKDFLRLLGTKTTISTPKNCDFVLKHGNDYALIQVIDVKNVEIQKFSLVKKQSKRFQKCFCKLGVAR